MRAQRASAADFADQLGSGYINLVLRRLSQRIAADGDAYMRQTGVSISASSTSILAFVARNDNCAIADIASALGYSHQAVAKAIDGMERASLVRYAARTDDLRKRPLSLTRKGFKEAEQVEAVAENAAAVLKDVFEEIEVDIFSALRAFETALDRQPLLGRLLDHADRIENRGRRLPQK